MKAWGVVLLAAACGSGGGGGSPDGGMADGGSPDGVVVDAAGWPDAGPDAAVAGTGTIVPLYTDPSDPSWAALAAAKNAHPSVPVVAIVNPNSGPGSAVDPSYVSGISMLHSAGVIVIGYVSTSYAARPLVAVENDVDIWYSFYGPGLDGIFFDEQSTTPADAPYYSDAAARAATHGLDFTVGNPGTDTAPAFIGSVDVILIYESAGLPSATVFTGWHTSYDRRNFGMIPYAVPSLDAPYVGDVAQLVGWIYITDDDLPNPWDSLSSYFDPLLAALEAT